MSANRSCTEGKARPADIDIVFKPWAVWHALEEDLKEAKRLLHLTLAHCDKDQPVDTQQIRDFLGE